MARYITCMRREPHEAYSCTSRKMHAGASHHHRIPCHAFSHQIYSSTPTTRSTPSPPRSSHHPLGARTQRLWCRTSSSLIASFKKLRIGQVTAARTQQRQSTVAGSTPKYPLPPLLAIAASTLATS